MAQGHVRAQHGTQHIGNGHGHSQMPPDITLQGEQHQGGNIGCQIEQLGRGRGVQKVIAHEAHKQEDEKAASAGAEKSIIKTDDQANRAGNDGFGTATEARRVIAAHLLARQRIGQHANQHQRQQFA